MTAFSSSPSCPFYNSSCALVSRLPSPSSGPGFTSHYTIASCKPHIGVRLRGEGRGMSVCGRFACSHTPSTATVHFNESSSRQSRCKTCPWFESSDERSLTRQLECQRLQNSWDGGGRVCGYECSFPEAIPVHKFSVEFWHASEGSLLQYRDSTPPTLYKRTI